MTNTNFFLTACHFWQLIYILLQYNLEVHVFLKSWSRSSKLQARIIIKRKDYFTPYGWMGNASRHSHIVVEARVTCVTWCRIPLYLFHFLGERKRKNCTILLSHRPTKRICHFWCDKVSKLKMKTIVVLKVVTYLNNYLC